MRASPSTSGKNSRVARASRLKMIAWTPVITTEQPRPNTVPSATPRSMPTPNSRQVSDHKRREHPSFTICATGGVVGRQEGRERSPEGPCFSGEGGADASWLPANADRPCGRISAPRGRWAVAAASPLKRSRAADEPRCCNRRQAAVHSAQQAADREPADRSRASPRLPMQIGDRARGCASPAFGEKRVPVPVPGRALS